MKSHIIKMELPSKNFALKATNETVLPTYSMTHDHNAVNDAKVIGLHWAFFQSRLPTQ